MRNDRKNIVVEKSFRVGLQVIDYSEQLTQLKKFAMANQIFRSGTSIGANIREAQNTESKKDFIHKMKVSAKEADETAFFPALCQESAHYPDPGELVGQVQEIILILSKIIATSKNNTHDE